MDIVGARARDAVARDSVEDGEFDLFVVCIEIDEERIDFVEDFGRASILSIDLIEDDDDG